MATAVDRFIEEHNLLSGLKNAEVMKLLEISANTLQRLRVSGKLPSSKAGGIHYYRYEDIDKLLNSSAAENPLHKHLVIQVFFVLLVLYIHWLRIQV